MKLEVGTHCPFHIEEGVMIDFVEDQWLILIKDAVWQDEDCLLYTSPSPRDRQKSRMPSSA